MNLYYTKYLNMILNIGKLNFMIKTFYVEYFFVFVIVLYIGGNN